MISTFLRPKEKVGENPPDNDAADPIRRWIIRKGGGRGKRAAAWFSTALRLNSIAVVKAHGK